MTKLAAFFSYLFHPLLMTTLLFLSLFLVNSSVVLSYSASFQPLMLIIFLVTFVIPAMSIGFLRITNTITSFKLEERKERILPFIFISVFYGVASWMFMTRINLGVLINVMLIGITVTILLLTIITFFWKISAHGAGVGGVLGLLAIFYLKEPALNNATSLIVGVIVAGIVMSSRLKLNSHNPAQVYSGLLLGFFTTFLSIYFFA